MTVLCWCITQAIADMREEITGTLRFVSESLGVDSYQARIETLQHIRDLLAVLTAKVKPR